MPDPNDVSQMARDLAMSEPLMVLGKLAAEGGQHVQDAYDTIKQHLSDLGTKAEKAVESGATTVTNAAKSAGSAVSAAAGKVADAIVPKLKAEEQTPSDQYVKLPDGSYVKFPATMSDDQIKTAITKNGYPAEAAAPVGRTWTDTAVSSLPAVGGAIGGLAGNVPGALLGGAAGEAYKQLIQRARGQAAPVSATEAAGQIAGQGAIQGAAQAVGEKVVGPVLAAGGRKLMQSALKPTLAVAKQYRTSAPAIVQTLLDEGVSVTKSGVAKLEALVNATNDQIKAAISGSSAEVPALRVAGRLNDTAKTFTNQVNPSSDLAAISQAGQEFLNHPRINPAGNLSVQDAQALKQGTYQQLRGKFGELKAADTEAQKALARGLKEEVATAVPGVSDLNAHESQLLAALDATGRRVALTGNRDPIGFAWVTHNPLTFLTALADRSPAFKSYLGRGLYSTAAAAAKVSPQLLRVALQAAATTEDAGPQEGPSQ